MVVIITKGNKFMAGNTSLNSAKSARNDEFYTQLTDIEKELSHYKEHFKDKIVFCNCDDPEYSNFWKYFQLNFYHLGLKKLISTHYEVDKRSYKMEIVRKEKGLQMGIPDYVKTDLKENGDFRSQECIDILQEADIVVTNPPFSLFREYLAQLIECNKKFVIIGNQNIITYKDVFPLLKDNKVWFGYNSGAHAFVVPNDFEKNNTYMENGIKYAKFGNICWVTNLDIPKRHEELFLYRNYKPEEYPKYDNYDAINVDKVQDIPCDYYGVMGVPITFMDKYNPEQFKIIGCTEAGNSYCLKFYTNMYQHSSGRSFYNMKSARYAPMVKYLKIPNKDYYTVNESDGYLLKTYFRIFIQRRKQNEN